MKAGPILQRALKLAWRRKYLWLFGFFVAGGSGGGPARSHHPGGAHGVHLPGSPWVIPLLAAAVILGALVLVAHVVSEAALIEGTRRESTGERYGIRAGWRVGLQEFWRVLGLKLIALSAITLLTCAVAAPAFLATIGGGSLVVGFGLTFLLALLGMPAALTLYAMYELALRVVVLEGAIVTDALRSGREWLHGRLRDALVLLLLWAAGSLAAGIVTVLALIPVGVIGLVVYFTSGLVPAAVAGGALALPLMACVAGAAGTYRSSVWTLGYLEGRQPVRP